MTHLLCSSNLQKNVENWLVKLCVTGKEKESIVPDIFSRQIGDIYEHGLFDAEIPKQFWSQMKVVKEKCMKVQKNGWRFYEWFVNKEKCLHHVIALVLQGAGLGCPPLKFTMNRLELADGVIQDHIKQ
ncbi:Hypothetical predicted protein [Paramuricea clavata]|uniref:Uncharacterized protein n=1 Tax=Paramuricea clavata TaxID=317549 RepID=A0A7D9DSL8_PARCT|nr:Hypothetical predicted protein [Paramuricea clavata]